MFRLANPTNLPKHEPVERDLVERCLAVDKPATRQAAQRQLFERYKRAMFSTAYRIQVH